MRNLVLFAMLFVLGSVNAVPTVEVIVNGTVFHDLNRDGIWDDDEDGLTGITVNLVDENGSVVDTAETEDGYYLIDLWCFPWRQMWVELDLPITVEHTGEVERYEFQCISGTDVYSEFGVRILTCEGDEDCYDKSWCSEGLCLPLNCSEGYIAVYHECIPEYECSTPDDCGYNETCSAGMCEELYCAGLEGYVIEGHKCIPVEPELECTADEECGEDEVCSENVCVQITCPEDYVVEDHTCVYVPPEVPEEEVIPEEVPKENVTEEEPEESPEEEPEEVPPEEEVPGEVPEEGKPEQPDEIEEAGGKVTTEMVLVALLILAAAIVVTYMVLYKKQ